MSDDGSGNPSVPLPAEHDRNRNVRHDECAHGVALPALLRAMADYLDEHAPRVP